MTSKEEGVLIEVLTPEKSLYSGRGEMLIVSTQNGEEGFLRNHAWCCKLLAESGTIKIREVGQKDFKIASFHGGYVDIKDHFVVYADKADWVEEEKQ